LNDPPDKYSSQAHNRLIEPVLSRDSFVLGFSEYSQRSTPLQAAQKCLKFGLTALQLVGDFPANFPENIPKTEREKVKNFICDNGIHLHYHAPSDIPLASRHNPLREGGLLRLREYIELAAQTGAKSFIFHPSRFAFYKISSGKIVLAQKDIPEIYLERFYDSAARLVEYTAGRLDVLLENTYNFTSQFLDIVTRFLNLPSTGLVWDIGHKQPGQKDCHRNHSSKMQIAEFFSERLNKVKLAHLHDTSKNRGHLPLGSGKLDIAAHIEIFIRSNIDMIIEVFNEDDLKASIEYVDSIIMRNEKR
jgi:sugar phosphate isomerase/epimerase